MTYQQRTPVENPYCGRQHETDAPATELYIRADGRSRGLCGGCSRFVDVRRNGTAKLHKMYGRRQMAAAIAAYKNSGSI